EEPANAGSEDRVAVARQILAPYSLTVTLVQPGLYAVVPTRSASSKPAPGDDAPAVVAQQAIEELREVVVSGSRYRFGDTSSAVFVLDRLALTEQPGIGDDPLRGLTRLPGITQDGLSAQTNVRGGEAGEVLMLLDGYPLRRAFHLAGYLSLFSVLDSGLIRGAEIFTGGYPARYGNRMSGVFDFHTVRTTDEPRHSLGVDFFNATGRAAGSLPWADVDYVASARLGTLSPLLAAFAPSVGDPRYGDAYLRMEGGDPDVLRVSGNFLWARDELHIASTDRGEQADIEDRLRYLWLRADRDFRDDLSGSVWLGQSQIQSVRRGTVASPGVADGSVNDSRASTIWDLRTRMQWQPQTRHVIEAGLEFTQEEARYHYRAAARFSPAVQQLFGIAPSLARDADLSPLRRRTSVFASHRWQLGHGLTSELGVRAQGIVSKGLEAEWVAEPRVALRWELNPRTRLHLDFGRFHQADEVHELKVEDGLDNFPASQRSDHLIAGIEHQLDERISLRAEIFSKRQTDPRPRFENQLNRLTILPEIAPDRVQVLPEYAELHGLELSAELQQDAWHGWMSTSWSVAEDETAGVHTPRSWDQTWSLTAGARWERGPWIASGALNLHRGFPITALLQTPGGPQLGPRNGARLPNFMQLDLRLQYTQAVQTGALAYSFELINATDRPNNCCTELLNGPQGLYGRPLRGLPLFPSLGVRWNW
ncbi:MAG TPA: TonB-dependent receptor, partial [Steroidobacteraceae bacterium]|nr:TonB-dependent receptor [Steroidobacteraceae bacterium]